MATEDQVKAYMEEVTKQQEMYGDNTQSADASSSSNYATPDATLPKPTNERALSMASKRYDLANKGYLNETERALRRLDSQGLGYLSPEKVYDIMDALQQEQKSNTVLINELRQESKRNLNLKKCIMLLIVFTILLGLSNIATSFAAARLAKDTQVSYANDLTGMNGVRLGTTSKVPALQMQPVIESRRRRLQQTNLYCAENLATTKSFTGSETAANASMHRNCTLQGHVTYQEAAALYQQFCPNWKIPGDLCVIEGGVPAVNLQCNGHASTIFGPPFLPDDTPGPSSTNDLIAFPAPHHGYKAEAATFLFGFLLPCTQQFSLGMACDDTQLDSICDIFASWETDDENACAGGVELCGKAPPPLSRIVASGSDEPKRANLFAGGTRRQRQLRR